MEATHNIDTIIFSDDQLILSVNGKKYALKLREISKKLLHSNEVERNLFKISSFGYGVHCPLIAQDLAIDSLIR